MKILLVACLVATVIASPVDRTKRNVLPGDSRYDATKHGASSSHHNHHHHDNEAEIKKALVTDAGFYSKNAIPTATFDAKVEHTFSGDQYLTPFKGEQYLTPLTGSSDQTFKSYEEATAQAIAELNSLASSTPTVTFGSDIFSSTENYFPTSTFAPSIDQGIVVSSNAENLQNLKEQTELIKDVENEQEHNQKIQTIEIKPTEAPIIQTTQVAIETKSDIKDSSVFGHPHTSVSIVPSVSFDGKDLGLSADGFGSSYGNTFGSAYGNSFGSSFGSSGLGVAQSFGPGYLAPDFGRFTSDFGLRYGAGSNFTTGLNAASILDSGYIGASNAGSAYKTPNFLQTSYGGISNLGSYAQYQPGFTGYRAHHTNTYTSNDVPLRTVDREVHVRVPQPYPVPFHRNVPYPVPVPTPVNVPRPYYVRVPQPFPVHVDRPVPVDVPRPVPYPVPHVVHVPTPVHYPQPVPVPHPVHVPHPVPVEQPYAVPRPVPYPVAVPEPVPVQQFSNVPEPIAIPQPTEIPHNFGSLGSFGISQSTVTERPFGGIGNVVVDEVNVNPGFIVSTTEKPFEVSSPIELSQPVTPVEFLQSSVSQESFGGIDSHGPQDVVIHTTDRPFTTPGPSISTSFPTSTLSPLPEVTIGQFTTPSSVQKYDENGGYVY